MLIVNECENVKSLTYTAKSSKIVALHLLDADPCCIVASHGDQYRNCLKAYVTGLLPAISGYAWRRSQYAKIDKAIANQRPFVLSDLAADIRSVD